MRHFRLAISFVSIIKSGLAGLANEETSLKFELIIFLLFKKRFKN